MTRREQLENIIIGTLLESNEERNYFDDCKCFVSQDMFIDDANRRIFAIIKEMNGRGKVCTDPCTIFKEYGAEVLDLSCRMVDLCTDYSFIHKKTQYNEMRFVASCATGVEYKGTDVQFVDYVMEFVKIVTRDEEQRDRHLGAENAAA